MTQRQTKAAVRKTTAVSSPDDGGRTSTVRVSALGLASHRSQRECVRTRLFKRGMITMPPAGARVLGLPFRRVPRAQPVEEMRVIALRSRPG